MIRLSKPKFIETDVQAEESQVLKTSVNISIAIANNEFDTAEKMLRTLSKDELLQSYVRCKNLLTTHKRKLSDEQNFVLLVKSNMIVGILKNM